MDTETLRNTLNSPPFIDIEGVINFRDFGCGFESATNPGRAIRAGYLFRSGELSRLTESGKKALHDSGIKYIFDMRNEDEISSFKSATPDIAGVKIFHIPFPADETLRPEDQVELLQKFETDPDAAFSELYTMILDKGVTPYKTIIEHLRDNPDSPCLLHCTAGKDRTGIIAALILKLLGAKEHDICHDFHLTEIGLQPAIPAFVARFQNVPIYRDNWKGFTNSGVCKETTMSNVLEIIDNKYGGAEGYVKDHLGMTDDDIKIVRNNLLVPDA